MNSDRLRTLKLKLASGNVSPRLQGSNNGVQVSIQRERVYSQLEESGSLTILEPNERLKSSFLAFSKKRNFTVYFITVMY